MTAVTGAAAATAAVTAVTEAITTEVARVGRQRPTLAGAQRLKRDGIGVPLNTELLN